MRRTLARGASPSPALALGPAAGRPRRRRKKITSKGVGQVKLGKTFDAAARDKHLVGKLRDGCELERPEHASSRSCARRCAGTVDFTQTTPRKVSDITITGGARGARRQDRRQARPTSRPRSRRRR